MTSPHEQALAAAVEALCQASLFDGDGHGCGGCCQAKVRFGKEAEATVRAYLAALPASDLADGLVVKPLAWEPVETWKQCSKERAKAFGGEYQIVMLDPDDDDPLPSLYFEIGLGAFMFRFEQAQDPMGLPGETCPRKFPSVEAAKAAAQSDYERRIRSAIDTTALSAKLAAVERERDTLTERLAEMEAALEPFSDMAGELFARNWNTSDVVIALDNPCDPHRVTAGDFFAARRARKETPDAQ